MSEILKSLSFREKAISLGSSLLQLFLIILLCYKRIWCRKVWDGAQYCLFSREIFSSNITLVPFFLETCGSSSLSTDQFYFLDFVLTSLSHTELTFLKWFGCLNCEDIFPEMHSEYTVVKSTFPLHILIIANTFRKQKVFTFTFVFSPNADCTFQFIPKTSGCYM